jgi:capsid protein
LDLRLKLQPLPESKLADLELPAGMDDAMAMAHAEDVEAWQKAISAAMPETGSVKFQQLLALTELEPVELLIRLLLGSWNLKQQGFYGEIEIWSEAKC